MYYENSKKTRLSTSNAFVPGVSTDSKYLIYSVFKLNATHENPHILRLDMHTAIVYRVFHSF